MRVGRALLSGAIVVAGATGAAGTAGMAGAMGMPLQRPLVEVSPPPADWPEGGRFDVFLCEEEDAWENCHGRAITAEQQHALELRLRAMPEVAEVAFVSREERWSEFKRLFADDEVMLSAMRSEDMMESFRGRLRRWDDIVLFPSKLVKKVAGVSDVHAWGDFFWEGKADVRVALCGPRKSSYACKGRGPATVKEKKAIAARLGALEESQDIYFENAAHARREFEHVWGKTFPSSLRFAESYYVKLADPKRAKTVIDAVKGMAGVQDTRTVGDRWPTPLTVQTR